ncbi:MAG: sigma-70 family RNA polymerase sigma factor [Microbacterium sp.]
MNADRAVSAAIPRPAREEGGHGHALHAARFGDLDLADESVQDALVQAVETWSEKGIPLNPAGWLYTVAHNRAIDRLRRAAASARRLAAAAPELASGPQPPEEVPIVEHSEVGDEQLRLMLLCCHPALDRDAQVALTLRLVGGLTTPEIAAAFLVPEATLAQRIVRAKRKIRDARIPLTIPADLGTRVEALLTVLLLVFNEGYLSRSGVATLRVDLAEQAIRLTDRARQLLPDHPEVEGLLALELYQHARAEARLGDAGELVLLRDQDRSRWDAALIRQANALVRGAVERGTIGPFLLQALIASQHANTPSSGETDWSLIADLYARLLAVSPTPVVAVNRAVAVGEADGPRAGLALLDEISGIDGYHLLHAAHGELLARAGETDAAIAALRRARDLAPSPAERVHLERRLSALE